MLSAVSMLFVAACGPDPEGAAFDPLAGMHPVAKAPQLSDPPSWMVAGCPNLIKLVERDYPQSEVEDTWRLDERVYEECKIRHAALRNFYRKRDEVLRAAGKP